MKKSQIGVGIIGCGKISQAYFDGAKTFNILKMVACADLIREAAEAKADENDCKVFTVDELLEDPEIDLVINLTIPAAHAGVSMQVLQAGKHVYCEKPLAVDLDEAKAVLALAKEKGLLVACAPDTFLGAGIQTCRDLVDGGAIGKVTSGTVFMLSPGPESWHPNPGFYYSKGGGPVFDMAPYYLTALVNLIGPINRVCTMTSKALETRTATCEARRGESLRVEVCTHASATIEFHSGAIITAVFSFDVQAHQHHNLELYGTEGSLHVPDPNTFDGPVKLYQKNKANSGWKDIELTRPYTGAMRSIGVADLAYAILGTRPHRASGGLAYHVLEVMCAFDQSSKTGQTIKIESKPKRPTALPTGLSAGELDA